MAETKVFKDSIHAKDREITALSSGDENDYENDNCESQSSCKKADISKQQMQAAT